MDTLQTEKQKILTTVDTFLKHAEVYTLSSLNSVEIGNHLLTFFSHHNIPKFIACDSENTVYVRSFQCSQN